MSASRMAALALIVIGVLMLGYPVLSYTTHEKVLDLGPVEVTRDKEHTIPLSPLLGGAALVVGGALLIARRRGRD